MANATDPLAKTVRGMDPQVRRARRRGFARNDARNARNARSRGDQRRETDDAIRALVLVDAEYHGAHHAR